MSNGEIIVPVEWTQRSLAALRPARALARQSGRALHLVSVIPAEASSEERHLAVAAEAAEAGIENPRISVFRADLNTTTVGAADGSLMTLLREAPDALVCMATHARSAIGDLLLGSVATDVINGTHHPVVLAGPRFSGDWDGPVRTLITCLDGSSLSEAVLAPVAALAKATGAELLLVQVQDPDATRTAMTQDAAESGYLQAKAANVRAEFGLSPSWDVLHGKDAGRAIADYVAGYPGAMVALTTHGHTGVRKLAVGSVARDVVHGASCPVMVLRPATAT